MRGQKSWRKEKQMIIEANFTLLPKTAPSNVMLCALVRNTIIAHTTFSSEWCLLVPRGRNFSRSHCTTNKTLSLENACALQAIPPNKDPFSEGSNLNDLEVLRGVGTALLTPEHQTPPPQHPL